MRRCRCVNKVSPPNKVICVIRLRVEAVKDARNQQRATITITYVAYSAVRSPHEARSASTFCATLCEHNAHSHRVLVMFCVITYNRRNDKNPCSTHERALRAAAAATLKPAGDANEMREHATTRRMTHSLADNNAAHHKHSGELNAKEQKPETMRHRTRAWNGAASCSHAQASTPPQSATRDRV